ncbi:hypothetical protein XANCAGTX0491_002512 [Xanthoria calcicola]
MAEPSTDLVYVPTERADVDSTGNQPRPRKYANGKKLWMKNSQGIVEWVVIIVSATYNSTSHRWEYTVKDANNQPIKGTVKEKDLAV